MSDSFRPGGLVPVEAVTVFDKHYRVVMQEMAAWGTPSGFAMYHYTGVVSKASATATCDEHREAAGRGRMSLWLEEAPIGAESFVRVTYEQ